jgi:O-antigen/teichoic acid export membrane protein
MNQPAKRFDVVQTVKNIFSNTFLFLLQTLINLWYTPFLVRRLGSALFSFIPLASSVTNYFSIFTFSINKAIKRHITIELEKGNTRQANQIFNTNLVATLLLISAVMPFAVGLVLLAPILFNIPSGMERTVQYLFTFVIAAFLLTTYSLNFSLATFARNRFDLRNLVALGARVAQILVIVGLFSLDQPSLIYVGVGMLLAALFNLAGDLFLWRKLLPVLKIRRHEFHRENLKLLFSTGLWNFIYQAGFILFLNVDMLVANRALDLNLAGMYGALLVIPKNLRIFSVAIGEVWGPSIMTKFSQSDMPGVDKIMRSSIKLSGLTLALIAGLIAGLSDPFLTVWLGPNFKSMIWVLVLMVLPLCTNLLDRPFLDIFISMNKLRLPALVSFGLGISNFLLAALLTPRLGVFGLVLAGGLTLTINYSMIIPIYAAIIMDLPWWHYLKRLVLILFVTLIVAGISWLIAGLYSLTSYLHLILVGGLVSVIYLVLVYFLVLSDEEKSLLKSKMKFTRNGHKVN